MENNVETATTVDLEQAIRELEAENTILRSHSKAGESKHKEMKDIIFDKQERSRSVIKRRNLAYNLVMGSGLIFLIGASFFAPPLPLLVAAAVFGGAFLVPKIPPYFRTKKPDVATIKKYFSVEVNKSYKHQLAAKINLDKKQLEQVIKKKMAVEKKAEDFKKAMEQRLKDQIDPAQAKLEKAKKKLRRATRKKIGILKKLKEIKTELTEIQKRNPHEGEKVAAMEATLKSKGLELVEQGKDVQSSEKKYKQKVNNLSRNITGVLDQIDAQAKTKADYMELLSENVQLRKKIIVQDSATILNVATKADSTVTLNKKELRWLEQNESTVEPTKGDEQLTENILKLATKIQKAATLQKDMDSHITDVRQTNHPSQVQELTKPINNSERPDLTAKASARKVLNGPTPKAPLKIRK
jgi:hypothetical protein